MADTAWDFAAPMCGTCLHCDVMGRGMTALAWQDGRCTVTGTEHVGADACDCAGYTVDTRTFEERRGALFAAQYAYLEKHGTAGLLRKAAQAAASGERPAVNVGGLLFVPEKGGKRMASSDYSEPSEAA